MSDASAAYPLHVPQPRGTPRRPRAPGKLDQWWSRLSAIFVAGGHRLRGQKGLRVARKAERLADSMRQMDDDALRMVAAQAGARLRQKRSINRLPVMFAALREVVFRVTGLWLNPRQLQGGALIWTGALAEMETGEGKTLTAVLPAVSAALAGEKVHVITVNDYLAERDHQITKPIFDWLGLASSVAVRATPSEDRWAVYRAPIVYACNTEIAFDHLRDRTEMANGIPSAGVLAGASDARPLRLPSLDMAIVDEADSVLVDEARTPLILSGEAELIYDEETCVLALEMARAMEKGRHFKLVPERREVTLLAAGRDLATQRLAGRSDRWTSQIFREDLLRKAISALYLYERDIDYALVDDTVQIVDENTGRIFPDRNWSMGLHQLVEIKEGLPPSPENATRGRLTYQSLFTRYDRVGGMSGTVAEAARELWSVYRLSTGKIPTFKPSRRRYAKDRIFLNKAERETALTTRILELSKAGVPVLVGTRTVEASMSLSDSLKSRKIEHSVLNAISDEKEAVIVSRAGRAGQITIATNMAGRGTDIRLDDEAIEAGGLHVILTERHDSGRIDRQLQGRCARQGDPGVCEAFLSLDDRLLASGRLGRPLKIWKSAARHWPSLRGPLLRVAQRRLERAHGRARWQLLQSEFSLDKTLAFSGVRE